MKVVSLFTGSGGLDLGFKRAGFQTFPNGYIREYGSVSNGYKMVGNAVPVELAYHVAKAVKSSFTNNG